MTGYLAGMRNGTWLDAQDFSTVIEAGELARTECSPQCLLADEPGSERDCECRCGGRHHGKAANVLVDRFADPQTRHDTPVRPPARRTGCAGRPCL